jgi:sulfopyruvate decarboxylase subunit alpha
MKGKDFCDLLRIHGYDCYTGVPDSTLGAIFEAVYSNPGATYISAVREDSAIGVAVGAYLAGRYPVVLMQNSGLGLSINALASLAILYSVPLLLIIGWRGASPTDAPEHLLMGEASIPLLEALKLAWWAPNAGDLVETLRCAISYSKQHTLPAAILLRGGLIT